MSTAEDILGAQACQATIAKSGEPKAVIELPEATACDEHQASDPHRPDQKAAGHVSAPGPGKGDGNHQTCGEHATDHDVEDPVAQTRRSSWQRVRLIAEPDPSAE